MTPTTTSSPLSIWLKPAGAALDQAALHVVDSGNGAAHFFNRRKFGLGFFFQCRNLAGDFGRTVEDVGVFEQVGLIGQDLLHPQRPLLIPRPRQTKRFVPGWQLHGTGAGVLRQRHRQHFQQNTVDVVFGLRLSQAERVDLDAVAEHAVLGVSHAIAFAGDVIPQFVECPHFAHFSDEAHAGVDEE